MQRELRPILVMTLVCCVAISQPRVAGSGKALPNPRQVTITLHSGNDVPDYLHTLTLMLFGQFLAHDMSKTAISTIAANEEGQLEDVFCS